MSAKTTDWIGVATLVVLTSFLSGLCILSWQIYGYLRFENRRSLSVIDAIRTTKVGWASFPTDWMGLYRILEWMPISLALPLIGVILAFIIGLQESS
jgi:hypothetical protein